MSEGGPDILIYMSKLKPICPLSLSLILLFQLFPNFSTAQEAVPESLTETNPIEEKLKSMPLEKKVGQLFIIGFPQTEMDKKLSQHLKKFSFNAFLLFKRNISSPTQLETLNRNLYELSEMNGLPLPIIAVDQEGGFVSRIPIQPMVPSALSIGLTKSPVVAEKLGEEVGKILFSLGFNMNLAPVLDLSSPNEKSFIGIRSFGGDPQLVAELGTAYSKGLQKSFVVPTAKHFPGLGYTQEDPHEMVVSRKDSFKELAGQDLVPFENYTGLGSYTAIMLSHMSYPQLDESNEPASFSKKIINTWLRKEYGFEGLVITDDLHMKASTGKVTLSEGAIKALDAGADMIMLSWSFKEQEKTYQKVLEAYKSGRLSMDDLNDKLKRILGVKSQFKSYQTRKLASLPQVIYSRELQSIEGLAFQTKLSNFNINLAGKSEKSCLYSSQDQLLNSFREKYNSPLVRTFKMHPNLQLAVLEKSLQTNGCPTNLMTIYNRQQSFLVNRLSAKSKKNTFVVNFGSSVFIKDGSHFLGKLEILSAYTGAGSELADFVKNKTRTTEKASTVTPPSSKVEEGPLPTSTDIKDALPKVESQHDLEPSRAVEAQNFHRPDFLRPTSSRPE